MRIIWALANLFSHWTAMSNADCWSHTKNPPLYTCAADIKIISFWVLKPAAAAVQGARSGGAALQLPRVSGASMDAFCAFRSGLPSPHYCLLLK